MIEKLRKKFSLFAIFSVFIFLTLILVSINIVNFTLVSSDADSITKTIQNNHGHYENQVAPQDGGSSSSETTSETSSVTAANLVYYANGQGGPGGRGEGPMGPDSPEMKDSLRYFTVSYDQNDAATLVEYKINIFTQEEAISLADSLKSKSTGWVKQVYRFRTWTENEGTVKYVTVIDQSRELRPTYNVLYGSLIGGGVGLLITIAAVYFASKRIVRPLEEADNKQKRFIANAAIALRTPVSILSFDNATLKEEKGETEANKSIDREVKVLLDLANDLNSFSLISSTKPQLEQINLSNVTKETVNRFIDALRNKREVTVNIEDDIVAKVDIGMMQKMLSEILENCLKYSDTHIEINLYKKDERIVLEFNNDCKGIQDGPLDQVFDRFYRLDNASKGKFEGNGIGLAIVKDIVDKHQGRVRAKGKEGCFNLKVEL